LDHVTKQRRSEIMSKIRGKNTTPELVVRKIVHSLGYRYRLHAKNIPGKPDLVFIGRKKAIFVHGCFWHGHDCNKGKPPNSNEEYWFPKLEANKIRDRKNIIDLEKMGWKVLIVWQCNLKNIDSLRDQLIKFLNF